MAPKTVLIAGATRGIGLCFAQYYLRAGWNVIATARNTDTCDALKALKPSKVLQLDSTDEDSISRAAEDIKDVAVDLLINNAGILKAADLMGTDKENLMEHFTVNTVGPFLITKAFLPHLKRASAHSGKATVSHITSRMGSIADAASSGYYGYRISKCGLNMLSKCLSLDLKEDRIISVVLHPGYVKTDMTGMRGYIPTDESVDGLAKVIDSVKFEDSGKFYSYKGEIIPW